MKKRAMLYLILPVFMVSAAAFSQSTTYQIDPAKSLVQWTGRKVIGGTHTGTVKVKEGAVVFDKQTPKSGNVVIEMASIVDEDLTDSKMNKKLVGHLKSEDFFYVEKFPTATFDIKSAIAEGAGKFRLDGIMTIRGNAKQISVEASEASSPEGKVVESNVKIDRTTFDVRYGSGKFFKNLGDKMIADDIELKVRLFLIPLKK